MGVLIGYEISNVNRLKVLDDKEWIVCDPDCKHVSSEATTYNASIFWVWVMRNQQLWALFSLSTLWGSRKKFKKCQSSQNKCTLCIENQVVIDRVASLCTSNDCWRLDFFMGSILNSYKVLWYLHIKNNKFDRPGLWCGFNTSDKWWNWKEVMGKPIDNLDDHDCHGKEFQLTM